MPPKVKEQDAEQTPAQEQEQPKVEVPAGATLTSRGNFRFLY